MLLFAFLLTYAARIEAAPDVSCTVSTSGISFGSYNPLSGTYLDSTGTISVFCSGYAELTVALGRSTVSGSFTPRAMSSGSSSDQLNYNLYTVAARTQIWGDGTEGTATVPGTAVKHVTTNFAVYGRIPANQDVIVGSYSDTLVVTITW